MRSNGFFLLLVKLSTKPQKSLKTQINASDTCTHIHARAYIYTHAHISTDKVFVCFFLLPEYSLA